MHLAKIVESRKADNSGLTLTFGLEQYRNLFSTDKLLQGKLSQRAQCGYDCVPILDPQPRRVT